MAVSGSATVAYNVTVTSNGYSLECHKTTALSDKCDSVQTALAKLQAGEIALVAGSDMDKVRYGWKAIVTGEVTG